MDFNCTSYVSCIKIGRRPIIPPLLTDEARNKMRYYRDLAVSLEGRKKQRKNSTDSGIMFSSNDGSCPNKPDSVQIHSNKLLPPPDTSNELAISTCDSSSESDHDNVFFEPEENFSSHKQDNNSSPHNGSPVHDVVNPKPCSISERRNSYIIKDLQSSRAEDCEIYIVSERHNSCIVEDSGPCATENIQKPRTSERRNSYTLDCPSPIMLQYMQSFLDQNSSKRCDLFVKSTQGRDVSEIKDAVESRHHEVVGKELTLNDLITNPSEFANFPSKNCNLWSAHSDKTLQQILDSEIQKQNSLPSSVCASPVSVVRACESDVNLNAGSEEPEKFDNLNDVSGATAPIMKSSCECICNVISNFEPLKRSQISGTVSPKDHLDDIINDSFSQDFRYLDVSSMSGAESEAFAEGRYSECSSVSLSKFLGNDRLADGFETECVTFAYMKEQLEIKHRNEFKRLLQEQQKEHDNLRTQFSRISSLSKRSPSPKCNYAYSPGVVLKKYSPSEQNTPVFTRSLDGERVKSSCSTPKNVVNAFESKREILPLNATKDAPSKEEAATRIVAAARGYLTRRLFKTERVTILVETIRDCLATAVALQNETNLGLSELDLQSRLLQQLTVACNDLHDIFSLPMPEKMTIIATDREKKIRLSMKKKTPLPLSEATRRSLQRKIIAKSAPPGQQKYDKKRSKSVSSCTSETTSCRSTPRHRRPLATTILSQKYSVSHGDRRPWR